MNSVNRTPHTSHFLVFHRTDFNVARDIGSRWLSASRHPCFMRSVCSDFSSTLHFALFTVSLSLSLIFLFILLIFIFTFHVGRFGEKYLVRFRPMRSLVLLPTMPLPQVMSPTSSTTTPSAERSPLFSQEREDPASRRQAYHSPDESLLSSQSLSVMLEQGDLFLMSLDHSFQTPEKIRVATQKMSKAGFFWNDKKEQILADYTAEIQKHEFQADSDRRSIQELNGILESQRSEIDHTLAGDEQNRRDQLLLDEQLLKQNWDLREAQERSLNEMEQLKRFQGSTFDTIARKKLVEDQDTILELTAKIQELQNEINCVNDSRDFQDAESVRSGQSHVTSQPVFFIPHPVPGGMLSRSLGMPIRRDGPPSIWDTHGILGTFLQIQRRLLQHLIRKSRIRGYLMYQNTHHRVWWVKAKHQLRIRDASQDRQPEIQSSLVREDFQRIVGQTNNDCRFQILILTNSPRQQHSLVGR